MGYLGYFYVENKSFEFRSNVQGGVQLAEKSRGKTQEVIMASHFLVSECMGLFVKQ
jgi:hypothetical protein